MKRKVLLIIIILPIILGILFVAKEEKLEVYLNTNISQANYCSIKEDCIQIPYGCYKYITKNETGKITDVLNFYNRFKSWKLAYKCGSIKDYSCINNKCQVIR